MTITMKEDNMINERKLECMEAIHFLDCLYEELRRHKREEYEAYVASITNLNNRTKHTFWISSMKRHNEDCKMILKTIKYLEDKFELVTRMII